MSLQIKVCGMTDFNQVHSLAELGIDFAGFIFYPPSSRYVAEKITAQEIELISRMEILRVGVFVDEPIENLFKVAERWKLDFVQLHGQESPGYCKQASKYCKVVKAFRVGNEDRLEELTLPYGEVDSFLFDTKAEAHGGTGLKFNWQQLSIPLTRPYFLSGGIGPEDVNMVLDFNIHADKLFAIDINSKFEREPGIKDLEKVERFKNQLKKISHE